MSAHDWNSGALAAFAVYNRGAGVCDLRYAPSAVAFSCRQSFLRLTILPGRMQSQSDGSENES